MLFYRIYILLLLVILTSGMRAQTTFSFEELFKKHAATFDPVLKNKASYRLQIIYTQVDRDKNNVPHLTTYTYDADKYYYYCASLIKLPASALILEKLNNLSKYQVTMYDSLAIDSIYCNQLNPLNMMLGTRYSFIAHYIKEMLMISDNNAFNPVYDFLGQRYFQDRLRKLGYSSAVISNRFAACDTTQDRICDPVTLYDRHTHKIKYRQPCVTNTRYQYYNGKLDTKIGNAYYTDAGKLINQPKDFRNYNYISLTELHTFMKRIIFPETQTASQKMNLKKSDYQYLYKCMGMMPKESAYPKLDPTVYPDQYMNFFMAPDQAHVRVLNKVGQAFGFMTDCSYVVDTVNKVEFFITCSMYLNSDGVINDEVYDYDKIGYPFFQSLFKAIYEEEKARHKKFPPVLSMPDFRDTTATDMKK